MFVAPPDEEEAPATGAPGGGTAKDALLAEIRRVKVGFYRMAVAQAERIEVQGDRIVFSYAPTQQFLKDQLDGAKTWLEPLAEKVAGRRMQVMSVFTEGRRDPAGLPDQERHGAGSQSHRGPSPANELKAEAVADPDMKTLLELIPLEIRDVEKM